MSADATLSTLGQAALELVRQGFAVLRLRANGKEPDVGKGGVYNATRDEETVRRWWTEKPNANIGIACGGGLLVIDVDCGHAEDVDGWDAIREWEYGHCPLPDTVTATTASGGYHIFYAYDGKAPNNVNADVGIDFRGEGGYVVAAPSTINGHSYAWESAPDELAIAQADDNVRAFIASICESEESNANERYVLPDVIGHGGRNDELFHAGCSERSRGMDEEHMTAYLVGINQLRCDPPLDIDEVEKIAHSVCEYEPGHSEEYDATHPQPETPNDAPTLEEANVIVKGKLDTTSFAYYLTEHCHACHINEYNGELAVWDGHQYQTGKMISRFITKLFDHIKIREEAELLHTLDNIAPVHKEAPDTYFAFKNGIYCLDTGILQEATPDLLIVNTIPHNFIWDIDTSDMQKVLNDYACGDPDILINLYELIGACMWRSVEYAQCAILIGRGANGKSTYMDMIKAVLGRQNYTNLDIHLIGERFQTTQLYGKLADFADDIAGDYLKKTTLSDFKKAITGNGVAGERKNIQGMTEFEPYATFVISANEMPRFAETTEGMERRIHAIPFNASFRVGNGKQDAHIKSQLTSESACEQLIALGINGIASLQGSGQFTPNEVSSQMVHTMMVESDSVLQWIEIKGITLADIVEKPVDDFYAQYKEWSGEKHVGQPKFQTKMKERFPVDIRRIESLKKNYFFLANGGGTQ